MPIMRAKVSSAPVSAKQEQGIKSLYRSACLCPGCSAFWCGQTLMQSIMAQHSAAWGTCTDMLLLMECVQLKHMLHRLSL